MRWITTNSVALLCWATCTAAGAVQPVSAQAAHTVSLRTGETARFGDGGLQVGFEGVSADSRCAKGERCVWAGDATVRIWLRRGLGSKTMQDLHTATGTPRGAGPVDEGVRLVRLDPVPITGKAIAQSDYVATLVLSTASATAPDR